MQKKSLNLILCKSNDCHKNLYKIENINDRSCSILYYKTYHWFKCVKNGICSHLVYFNLKYLNTLI